MIDFQARVVQGVEGETSLYFWSPDKVEGGVSRRYAALCCHTGAIRAVLHLEDRSAPEGSRSLITSERLRPDTFPRLLERMVAFIEGK